MSGLIKYRVHEVAKDFNMTSKEITQILTDYATTPKNHMQVLEDAELNDIFEYLTQHHQAASGRSSTKCPTSPRPSRRQRLPRRRRAAPRSSRGCPDAAGRAAAAAAQARRRTTSRTSRVRWQSAALSIPAARRRTCPSTTSVWTILCPSARRTSARQAEDPEPQPSAPAKPRRRQPAPSGGARQDAEAAA